MIENARFIRLLDQHYPMPKLFQQSLKCCIRQKRCKNKTYFSSFYNHSSLLNEQRIENGRINLSPISSLSITYLAEPFQYISCGAGHSVSQNTQQWSQLHGDHFLAQGEIKPLLLKFSSARGILRAYSVEFNEQ